MRPAGPGQPALKGWKLLSIALLMAGSIFPIASCNHPKPAPLPEGVSVVVRGHQEIELQANGSLLPVFFPGARSLGICLQTPSSLDSNQWQVSMFIDNRPIADFAPPTVVMRSTLCFSQPLPSAMEGDDQHALSGLLLDQFDGSLFQIPEKAIRLYESGTDYHQLEGELETLVQSRDPSRQLVDDLSAVSSRAIQMGFPEMAVRANLIATYYLLDLGTPEDLTDAEQRLNSMPSWLEKEEASYWGAEVALGRAVFEQYHGGDLEAAWAFLREAEIRQLRIAHGNHIFTVNRQAGLLAQVGAVREGRQRLRSALEDCQRWACNPDLIPGSKVDLTWLTLLDPQANDADFSYAEELLRGAMNEESTALANPLETSNSLINLALLQIRQGKDPAQTIRQTQSLLDSVEESARGRDLLGWLRMARASSALRGGDYPRAGKVCDALATGSDSPELAAWAWGCTARSRRLQGDLQGAEIAFDKALLIHAYSSSDNLGQSIALGPSRRGQDYYEAARVAIERGRADSAWEVLAALDDLASSGSRNSACEGIEQSSRNRADLRARDSLLRELSSLETPASASSRQQRAPTARSVRERLQELWRRQSDCSKAGDSLEDDTIGDGVTRDGATRDGATKDGATAEVEPRFRAFALPDEIILLERQTDGTIELDHRTKLPQEELRQRLADVEERLGSTEVSNESWQQLLAPIAAALIPKRLTNLEPVTSYALYGLLQAVPLSALPLPTSTEQEELRHRAGGSDFEPSARWLSEITLPIVSPANVAVLESRIPTTTDPVFVVDPLGNLATQDHAELYRSLFPQGIVLKGKEATQVALRRALESSQWLHIDAHGRFDAVFPELSSLFLADRPMTLIEIADLPLPSWFANLSGCETGTWPTTADRGRYGIGGLLSRRGVPWVIATQSILDDRLAGDFNQQFYRLIHSGAGLAEAYAEALEELRENYPAAAWGALVLIGSKSISIQGGKRPNLTTPKLVEEEVEASWKAKRFVATEKRGRS